MELFVAALAVYLIPTWFALFRKRKTNKAPCIVINVFLGWTVIGWVVAFAMAVSNDPEESKGPQHWER